MLALILALSLVSGALQRNITRWLAQNARLVNIVGGLRLVGIGIYYFLANLELIRLVFGFLDPIADWKEKTWRVLKPAKSFLYP